MMYISGFHQLNEASRDCQQTKSEPANQPLPQESHHIFLVLSGPRLTFSHPIWTSKLNSGWSPLQWGTRAKEPWNSDGQRRGAGKVIFTAERTAVSIWGAYARLGSSGSWVYMCLEVEEREQTRHEYFFGGSASNILCAPLQRQNLRGCERNRYSVGSSPDQWLHAATACFACDHTVTGWLLQSFQALENLRLGVFGIHSQHLFKAPPIPCQWIPF